MAGAILSYLGGWWARWFYRAANSRAPFPPAEPFPRPAPADPAPHAEPSEEGIAETAFLETIGREPQGAPQRTEHPADPLARAGTLAALQGLRQIPALQSLVEGVTQIMCRDEVSLDEIVDALQKDSALCVRVLGMANSAAVASVERIVDLRTAVQMLGIARVRRVAQAAFTLRDAQHMAEGLDWRHLWIHALATAAIAEELDRRTRPNPSPEIYMAALLHDVGKIVLSTAGGDAYRDILVASWNGEGRLEDLERGRLGVGHREAGVIFARGNRLSQAVVESIAHHDDPSQAESHRYEVALVNIANFVSKSRGLGFSGARLDASDGDLESLPAWKVVSEEAGWSPDPAKLEEDMADFFASLKVDLRGLR